MTTHATISVSGRRAVSYLAFWAFVSVLLGALPSTLHAQYYDLGRSPSNIRWQQMEAAAGKIIYPSDFERGALNVASYMQALEPGITYGFSYQPLKIPTILHTQNFNANGLVLWAPKRMEFEAIPSIDTYAQPWLKQLTAHEYRHAVQYGNIYHKFMRPVGWFLGQQSGLISLALLPLWFLEGDATQFETQTAAFGRALQPSFTIEYRAYMQEGGSDRFSNDKWFCGSYKDYIPDHYQLGYQMTAWSREKYGDDMWDRVTEYAARRPYTILPVRIALRKFYQTSVDSILRHTFADLNAYWSSLPARNNSTRVLPTDVRRHTTYTAPIQIDDSTVVVMKRDMDRYNRIVAVDTRTWAEKRVTYTGPVSSPINLRDSVLYWTEFRNSTLWDQQVFSKLCSYDLRTNYREVRRERKNALYATPMPGEQVATIGYEYAGSYYLELNHEVRYPFPDSLSIHGLAYDEKSRTLAFIALGDSGMWLGKIDPSNGAITPLTAPSYTTISNLKAGEGTLTFGSIQSGYDEVHLFDLSTLREYRLTTSRYGSTSPSPLTADSMIYCATYSTAGYLLAQQRIDTLQAVTPGRLPENVVNPARRKWDVPDLSALPTPAVNADSASVRSTRYRKIKHAFNPHSWAPISFNPFDFTQESLSQIRFGATAMSQDLLSSTFGYLAYGYSGAGHQIRGGIQYNGLAPKMAVNVSYGGDKQRIYGDPENVSPRDPLKSNFELNAQVSLPLQLSSGYHLRRLTPTANLQYLNALLYKPETNDFQNGLTRFTFSIDYADQVRMADRDFLPRWGYAVRVTSVTAPFVNDFSHLYAFTVKGYTPAIAPHHSLRLCANVHYQPSSRYAFYYKELYPRGADYDIAASRYFAATADYQLPLAYPDWGCLWGALYFNRIRLDVYYDFARFQGAAPINMSHSLALAPKGKYHTVTSYGGELIFDMRVFRMPVKDTSLGISVYKPSDRKGVIWGVNLSLPI